MRTSSPKSRGLLRDSAADNRAATAASQPNSQPSLAVVAGTFQPLGFAAGNVLDQVRHAREAAAKVLNKKDAAE
jgi:hypothetical protein